MTTPTTSSLPYPQAAQNNSPSITQSPSHFTSQSHAGPSSSSTPRSAYQPLPQQPVAGPSRPTQQPQYHTNGSHSQPTTFPSNQPNFNDPQLQARLALAAQQAAGGPGGLPSATPNASADGQDKRPPSVPPDFAAMAGVIGGLQNNNNTPDALMKQFHALQATQAQRARLGLSNHQPNTPNNPASAPSPANNAAHPPQPPSDSSQPQTQPHPAPAQNGYDPSASQAGPSQSQQPSLTNGNGNGNGDATGTPMSQQQRAFLVAQQERMRSAQHIQVQRQQQQQQHQQQQQQQPQPQNQARPPQPPPPHQIHIQQSQPPAPTLNLETSAGQAPSPARPPIPSALGRPPGNAQQQRQQFVVSLASFHKGTGIPLPTAIFNGERDGFFKVGDAWMDVVDLFMTIVKNGGIMAAMQQNADSPIWRGLLAGRGIPNPLPQPLPMPKMPSVDPAAPVQTTTDTVQYLVAAYLAWLQPFEHHMNKQRQAVFQRQQAQAVAAGRPPPPLPSGMNLPPSANGVPQFSPMSMSTPSSYSPQHIPSPSPSDVVQHLVNKGKQYKGKGKKGDKPANIKTSSAGASPANSGMPDTPASGKKRKRKDKAEKSSANSSNPSTPASAQHMLSQPPPPIERPPTPKRPRYRVEYKPIHRPLSTLGGWDRNTVAATFPKNSLLQGTRSIHELGIVDMEAVLMGLRSRIPSELAYAMTVLSMLSMPHPEEHIGGLPLHHLQEIFLELLDLIGESAYGEEGWMRWQEKLAEPLPKANIPINGDSSAFSSTDLSKLTFLELEQLGRDFQFSLEDDEFDRPRAGDRTGGQTEIVLAGVNILRNFSMLVDNQEIMAARPDLLNLLAAVTDAQLCRLPLEECSTDGRKPYSILEFARVRRDAVCILTNIGSYVRLSQVPALTTKSIFELLSTFLTSAWESLLLKEPIYGTSASISIRDIPSSPILSVNRALEAFCKLSSSDANREALGCGIISSGHLVDLFQGLVKLFPVDQRQFEAMHSIEECLAYYECLALSLYSLVFLSPLSTRTTMRSVPGATDVLSRVIMDTAMQRPDMEFKVNPFAILCRRLCETLGVLNGTVSASGNGVGNNMSFSSGGIEGHGWKFSEMNSKKVQRGWLSTREEQILGVVMGVKNVDSPTFEELESLCWGGTE